MIKSFFTVPYEDVLLCDDCGAEMKFTGECLYSYPPQYPHRCPVCNNYVIMDEVYPVRGWRRKEDEV